MTNGQKTQQAGRRTASRQIDRQTDRQTDKQKIYNNWLHVVRASSG